MSLSSDGRESASHQAESSLAIALKLLYPGFGFKRWFILGAVGILSAALGLGYLMRDLFESSLPRFLPFYLEAVLFVTLGVIIVGLAVYGFYRRVGPLLLTSRSGDNLALALYSRHDRERGPRVVAIGGGTGLSTLLRGLKEHTSNLTAIVTVADDGGSSGRLRRELGILPPGDFRNCLVAMAQAEPLMTRLFQYRFSEGSGLEGHSFGNLFIVAMSGVTGSFERAIYESSRVLAVGGRILPSTLSNIVISAQMEDEAVIRGESSITERGGRIKQLYLEPDDVEAYPEAVQAIEEAQLVIIGPGSLYTSILPNLLVKGIGEAVKDSKGMKVYVCNVATQKGETDGYSVADHVEALRRHAGDTLMDYAVVNGNVAPLGPEFPASPVFLDQRTIPEIELVQAELVNEAFRLHHDPHKLAETLLDLYHSKGKHRAVFNTWQPGAAFERRFR